MRWSEEDLRAYQAKANQPKTVLDEKIAAMAPKPSKYHNQAVVVDGYRFPSKLEAGRYEKLKALQAAGEVSHFLRQCPFHLPGGVVYRLDFLVFWTDGRVTYEDSKGVLTKEFAVKSKLVEALYPVKIELVTR